MHLPARESAPRDRETETNAFAFPTPSCLPPFLFRVLFQLANVRVPLPFRLFSIFLFFRACIITFFSLLSTGCAADKRAQQTSGPGMESAGKLAFQHSTMRCGTAGRAHSNITI